jgi:hypothetical protein
MPLIVGVRIINSGITFPLALEYSGGETAEAYAFYFKTLREEVWQGGLEQAVVMGDQSADLISAVNTLEAVPDSKLQFCNWHCVQAMIAKFTKAGYTAEELDGFIDGKIKVLGLKDLCWAYI